VSARLCIKIEDWPEIDRRLWLEARSPLRFDRRARIAGNWSERRCHIVCQGYGQWLAWLAARDMLDSAQAPEDRATPERLEAFVRQLQERVAPWSVTIMVQGVQRMLVALAPRHDWRWLRSVVSNLKCLAKPSRDKRPHMVEPSQLYCLGIELMERARHELEGGRYHADTMGRDGLLIAVLICTPVRIANLHAMEFGRHLAHDGEQYGVRFTAEETKTKEPYEAVLPAELSPWIEHYLRVHRKRLLDRGNDSSTHAVWVDRWGRPMLEHSVRAQIKLRTKAAFGKHVWPHLFRAIAATGFVDHAPELAAHIPDLLGHRDVNTSRRHYILSDGMKAHEAVQSVFEARRREALDRLKAERRGR
jgi:site-specific recombinase XerD